MVIKEKEGNSVTCLRGVRMGPRSEGTAAMKRSHRRRTVPITTELDSVRALLETIQEELEKKPTKHSLTWKARFEQMKSLVKHMEAKFNRTLDLLHSVTYEASFRTDTPYAPGGVLPKTANGEKFDPTSGFYKVRTGDTHSMRKSSTKVSIYSRKKAKDKFKMHNLDLQIPLPEEVPEAE